MLVFAHDYETTGVDAKRCGVVQSALCFARLHEDGTYEILSSDVQVLDPDMPIPAQASAIHGKYAEDVEGKPHWESYLAEQFELVNDTPIEAVLGFNSTKFDDVIARRCGLGEYPVIDLYIAARRFKDEGLIAKANLGTTYKGLTGRDPENAHDAFADITMTLDLVAPAMQRAGTPTLSSFINWLRSPHSTRSMQMPFGKHQGVKLCNLPKDYVRWALANLDLTPDLRQGLEQL